MADQKIKIGATYASKHEKWGPIQYNHCDNGVHIFTAIGQRSGAHAQFDQNGKCVFYTRGSRENLRTGNLESIGYFCNSIPRLRRRVVVEGEKVFDGVPVWKKRLKTPEELSEEAARMRSIAHLAEGTDYETSPPSRHISYWDKSGMTPETKQAADSCQDSKDPGPNADPEEIFAGSRFQAL